MNIGFLRASSTNTYLDCPFRFFLHFIVGFTSQPNRKAVLGTAVHLVLEILAKCKKTGHYKLCDKYSDYLYLTDLVFKRMQKEHPQYKFGQADYKFILEQVESVIYSRYNPLRLKILRTEHQFQVEVRRQDFAYKFVDDLTGEEKSGYLQLWGTMDLVTEFDKDTIEIIDYKTGERKDWISGDVKNLEDFMKDIQLRMYDLVSNPLYKQYKKRLLTIIFTRDGGPFTVSFSHDDWENSLAMFRQLFKQILSDKYPSRILDDSFRNKEYWKCDYVCQFGLYEHAFASNEGDIIYKPYKNTKKDGPPEELVVDDTIYTRITDTGTRICDQYYKILQEQGIQKAAQKLYQIRINVEGQQKVSKRNDYSNSKISKESIE